MSTAEPPTIKLAYTVSQLIIYISVLEKKKKK